MNVNRSLTIKQMTAVSAVTLVTLGVFMFTLFFHLVQQQRNNYLYQLKEITRTIEKPLSQALFSMEPARIQQVLDGVQSTGVLSSADVLLPDKHRLLHRQFSPEKSVPEWVRRVFELPPGLTVPLYASYGDSSSKTLKGYFVVQADAFRVYRFILNLFSILLAGYLLMSLILSISISWCINRLLVYPLRRITSDLQSIQPENAEQPLLSIPEQHKNDEFGMLIRSYNQSQTALSNARSVLSHMSTRYPLTDLPNTKLFNELVQQHLPPDLKNVTPCSVLVVGVSTFTEMSVILDSERQSSLMLSIASRLKCYEEEACLVAQLGQSEFVLLAKEAETPLQAMLLAERILESMNDLIELSGFQLRPAANIGIARYPDNGQTCEQLLNCAQSAMNLAYQQAKNSILFFETALTDIAHKRVLQESAILQGMLLDQFRLYFQPQIDMRDGTLMGAEVLLRWIDSDGNVLGRPDEFIPLAEETGLMIPLGDWILEESCRVLSQWQQQGYSLALSVNVSSKQLQYGELDARLKSLLQQYSLDPHLLTLEITETAHLQDLDSHLSQLQSLRQLGVSLALDDFGTGYSSLTHLKELPADVIKIDRSFTKELPAEKEMIHVLAMIAKVFQLEVVVEGVETEQQRNCLVDLGIYCAQGYLYSPGLPQEQFEQHYLKKEIH